MSAKRTLRRLAMLEEKWFEAWYVRQFKGTETLLKKDKEGSYCDDFIAALFIGFVAGWNCK